MDKDLKQPLPQTDLSWEWGFANHPPSLRRSSLIPEYSETSVLSIHTRPGADTVPEPSRTCSPRGRCWSKEPHKYIDTISRVL